MLLHHKYFDTVSWRCGDGEINGSFLPIFKHYSCVAWKLRLSPWNLYSLRILALPLDCLFTLPHFLRLVNLTVMVLKLRNERWTWKNKLGLIVIDLEQYYVKSREVFFSEN